MKNYTFCTCFDRNYCLYGATLLRSLRKRLTEGNFTLYVVALDDAVCDLLERLKAPEIEVVRLREIEAADPEFASCRMNRSRVEYYFTLSPVLALYLLKRFPEIEILNYLDSDLYFWDTPEALYRELGGNSLLIVGHNFPEELKWREKFGLYNVAFQLYRRSAETFRILGWWRERCLEWCYDIPEATRFADQKYLDAWPSMSRECVVAASPLAGVAPWNHWRNGWVPDETGRPSWNGNAVIYYHFQGFRFLTRHWLCHNLGSYGHRMKPETLRMFYGCYAAEMVAAREELMRRFPGEAFPLAPVASRTGFSLPRAFLSGLRHGNLMKI